MKRSSCFIDTSAFIALNHAGDRNYRTAVNIASQMNGYRFVVSDPVITETYSILRYRFGYSYAERFLRTVLDEQEYEIAAVTSAMRKEALDLLDRFNDQKISYCDALSVTIIRQMKIDYIFAFDHHFGLMGIDSIAHLLE